MKRTLFTIIIPAMVLCITGCKDSNSVVGEILEFISMEDLNARDELSRQIRDWEKASPEQPLDDYFFMLDKGINFKSYDEADSCVIQCPTLMNTAYELEAYKTASYPYGDVISELASISDSLSDAIANPEVYPAATIWYYIIFKRVAAQALVRCDDFSGFGDILQHADGFDYLELPCKSLIPAYKIAFYRKGNNLMIKLVSHT